MKYLGVALISLAITIWGLIITKDSRKASGCGTTLAVAVMLFLIIFGLLSLVVLGVSLILRG